MTPSDWMTRRSRLVGALAAWSGALDDAAGGEGARVGGEPACEDVSDGE